MGEEHSKVEEGRERRGCVVLHSTSVYVQEQDSLLRELIDEGVDLMAIVGVDCAAWEAAMGGLFVERDAVADDAPEAFCMTSSHPGQTLGEVVTYAEEWCSRHGWRHGWPLESVRVVTV